MSTIENKQAPSQQDKEKQRDLLNKEQKRNLQLSNAISKVFPKFSIEEKTQLLSLFKRFQKSFPTEEPRQILTKMRSLNQKIPEPKKFIQELQKLIQKQEIDLHNKANRDKILKGKNENPINNLSKINQRKEKLKNKKEQQEWARIEKERIIQQVRESHALLSENLKNFPQEQLQAKLSQLKPETQKKLQKQGISTTEYASFLLSRELIDQHKDQSPQTLDFLESLKSLESMLGIRAPDALPQPWVDKDYIRDNPDLIFHIQQSPDFEELSWPINFAWLKTAQDNFKFVKLFGDRDLIKLQDQISYFFDENGQLKALNPEEKEDFQRYRDALLQLKHNLSTTTGNLLKSWVMQAPAATMLRTYLDQDSIWPLNLSQQLKLWPKSSNIISENGDQILKIQGNIEGKSLNFYYNLSNPTATLQCDDYLNFDASQNRISIGEKQRTDLNIQLPSQKELISSLHQACSPEILQMLIETSSSAEDYQSRLNELIAETMQEAISPDPLITSRICMQTEKNLTSQSFSSEIIPTHLLSQLQNPQLLNNNQEVKKFFHILDYISENSTSAELISLRKGFKKLNQIIKNPELINTIADPVAKEHFFKLHQNLDPKATLSDRTSTVFDFFNLFLKQNFKDHAFDPKTLSTSQIFNFFDFEHFLDLPKLSTDLKSANLQSQFSEQFMKHYEQKKEANSNLSTSKDLQALEQEMEESFAFA